MDWLWGEWFQDDLSTFPLPYTLFLLLLHQLYLSSSGIRSRRLGTLYLRVCDGLVHGMWSVNIWWLDNSQGIWCFSGKGKESFIYWMHMGGLHTSCWGTEFIISPERPKSEEAGITIFVLWDQERFCNLLKAHVISLRDLGFRTPRFPQTHAGDSVHSL